MAEPFKFTGEYTSQEDRLTQEVIYPLEARTPDSADLKTLGVPGELGGLPAVGLVADKGVVHPGTDALVVYSNSPADGVGLPKVYAEGGLVLDLTPLEDALTADMMMEKFPGRLVPVRIGPWEGAVDWEDPDVLNNRQYGVFWEDENRGYWLSGASSAESLVQEARSIACTGR
ncbi:MAG: hypothetical protein JWO76_78 [Nocardioides sp.]|nr:hypothetical protein [Nocardioides sp.]